MKEASGELSMTLVTIIAVAAIATVIGIFWEPIKTTILNKWGEFDKTTIPDLSYVVDKEN